MLVKHGSYEPIICPLVAVRPVYEKCIFSGKYEILMKVNLPCRVVVPNSLSQSILFVKGGRCVEDCMKVPTKCSFSFKYIFLFL